MVNCDGQLWWSTSMVVYPRHDSWLWWLAIRVGYRVCIMVDNGQAWIMVWDVDTTAKQVSTVSRVIKAMESKLLDSIDRDAQQTRLQVLICENSSNILTNHSPNLLMLNIVPAAFFREIRDVAISKHENIVILNSWMLATCYQPPRTVVHVDKKLFSFEFILGEWCFEPQRMPMLEPKPLWALQGMCFNFGKSLCSWIDIIW